VSLTTPVRSEACSCRSDEASWPPEGSTIPTNGIIVLAGASEHRHLIADLNERHPALACGRRSIPLRLKDIYVGHRVVKALLLPARPLPPHTRCTLVLTQVHPKDRILEWLGDEPPWWTTGAGPDHRKPVWSASPRWTGRFEREEFCGFANGIARATASAAARDAEGPVLIRVLLDDGKEKNDFVIVPEADEIDVGHGPCYGAFELEEGRRYRATFSAVDAACNDRRAPGTLPVLISPP